MSESYELAIRIEDQRWYKEMILRIKISKAITQIPIIYKSIIDSMFPVFKELGDVLTKTLNEVFENIKPSIEEILDKLQELSIRSKPINSYNFYISPSITINYNQYQRKMIRDKRSDMRHFTIKK